nr:MAG TPA: hypothetical protein [Caudoviricetes sp.]
MKKYTFLCQNLHFLVNLITTIHRFGNFYLIITPKPLVLQHINKKLQCKKL